jgi:hypothetical protein
VTRASANAESALPFANLSELGILLRNDPMFAPLDREVRSFSLAGCNVSIETAGARTPLWAVDATLGPLLCECGTCRPALPFPGAVGAEGLGAQLWPNERGILEASTLAESAHRLIKLLGASRGQAALMRERLGHLRANSRAPLTWILLTGFAPVGLDQLGAAFGISRRGTYAVCDALVAAGMARRETTKGKVLLIAEEMHGKAEAAVPQAVPLPSPALAEFNAAMADIDRLLERTSRT